MPIARPKFADMAAAYPKGSADEVKAKIGGKVDLPWITNTCVIRVSRALNYSGEAHKVTRGAKMETISGADGLWYGFRVRQFIPYFSAKYGPADFVMQGASYEEAIAEGRKAGPARLTKGVVAMEISGWHDATGHVDLWNFNRCLSGACLQNDYLTKSSRLHFWALP